LSRLGLATDEPMMKILFLGLMLGLVWLITGCKPDNAAGSDDKALRAQFAKKTFDIKDVPIKDRARVQGFIDRAKEMAAQGKSPAAGK